MNTARIAAALLTLFATVSCATAANTGFVFHTDYLLHDPGAGHPERPTRLDAIMLHLEDTGVLDDLTRITPQPAGEQWLRLVHTQTYLEMLERSAAGAPAYLDPDTGISKASYRVARLATGGVLAAVDRIMDGSVDNAFAAVRPPGHHARPERAMGFCLLNHVAIANRYAKGRLVSVLEGGYDLNALPRSVAAHLEGLSQ